MTPSSAPPPVVLPVSWGVVILRVLCTALVYWGSSVLTKLMSISPGYAVAVWPAAGLALVAVLVWGPRMALGVVAGAYAANYGNVGELSPERDATRLLTPAVIALGATLQALVGGWLVRRFVRASAALESERDVLKFVLLGGPVSCVINASLSMSALAWVGLVPEHELAFGMWTWWVGDVIGVLIFAPLPLVLAQRGGEHSPSRLRLLWVGVPSLIGFTGVALLFARVSAWEDARLRHDFEARARPVGHALATAAAEDDDLANHLAGMFEAAGEVTPADFRRYALRAIARAPHVRALGWNRLVTREERPAYEARLAAEGRIARVIEEVGPDGKRRPAGDRAYYVPVELSEPVETNASAYGYDVASDPARRDMLEAAVEAGEPRVTSRVKLVQGVPGVLVVAPTYRRPVVGRTKTTTATGARTLVGFAVVVIDLGAVFDSALSGYELKGLDVRLVDDDAPHELRVLHEWRAGLRPPRTDGDFVWREEVRVAGRRWRAEVRSVERPRSWQPWVVQAGGLVFVGVIGLVVLLSTGRALQTQRHLEARTRDAARAEQAEANFRRAIEATTTGMLELDERGRIVLLNAQIERLFGWSREELLGRSAQLLLAPHLRVDQGLGLFAPERGFTPARGVEAPARADVQADVLGVRRDGAEFPLALSLSPTSTPSGRFVLASLADVTEERRAAADRERLMQELTTLNAELEARVQARTRELSTLVQQRDVLLQEVHHRVRNNLQVITSLLRMQVRELAPGADKGPLLASKARIQAIALVHERLYQSKDYARVGFAEYVRSLVRDVMVTMGPPDGRVRTVLAVDEVVLAVDRAIPCGLVLNELISNALEHAFGEGPGTIEVGLSRDDDGQVHLVVADDGRGLPEGADVDSATSMGLSLIRALTAQVDGRLTVRRERGTRFELTFAAEASPKPRVA